MEKKPTPDLAETREIVKISTTMDKATLEALRTYSKTSGMPIAEAIRRAVRMYLASQKKG